MIDVSRIVTALDAARGVHIAGRWRGATGVFVVEDPATGRRLAEVADGGAAEAVSAVDAASGAADGWAGTSARDRGDVLSRCRELMLRDADELAALVSAENGKSLADARSEIVYAAEFLRWYAEEGVRPCGDYGPAPDGETRMIVTHRPVGVAALVTPWNFPAAMATRKIAPALAAGCTVVLKPAAETPLTALAIVRRLVEAGAPPGVVNVVPGTDAGAIVSTWLSDPRVRKISFTGSTGVGRLLLRQAADRVVNASMELGGSAPFIVTDDADVDAAVAGAMIAKFRGGGQACTAANAFYVHERVASRFVAALGAEVEALTVGPADRGCDIGPLISRRALDDLRARLAAAVARGAVVAHRAPVVTTGGHFHEPVVVTGLGGDDELVRAEIFGPIAPVVTWSDEGELVAALNDNELGLAAYVYSTDLGRALRIAERLEAGMVGINRGVVSDPAAPFGGLKQSGIGREGARAGLEEYTETQYFSVDWPRR